MSLMQAPDESILLHRAMAREEHDRSRHPRATDLPFRPLAPLMTIRTALGRTLIAAGTRLEPRHDGADPVVGRLSAAR